MGKISLDNPLVNNLLMLLVGLIGFLFIQIETGNMNTFSILFILLSTFLFVYFLFIANILDSNFIWEVKPVNSIFCIIVIAIKIFLLLKLLLSMGSSSFDGRLSCYGDSFYLGIDLTISLFLFPIIPLFASSRIIRKLSICIWLISFVSSLVLAPSKGLFIQLFFSLLSYRFLKRKTQGFPGKINLFGIKSVTLFLTMFLVTLILIYSRVGSEFFNVFIHRVTMNFDIAIYASQINEKVYPEHSNFFYSVLPLLKRIDSTFNELEYYSIPQWVVSEALGISRYGRYGYPNDNFIVGLLLSFKYFGIFFFFSFLFFFYSFIKRTVNKKRVSSFKLYVLFLFPSFFLSNQDFMIKFYAAFLIYYPVLFVYLILPRTVITKKRIQSKKAEVRSFF